MTHKPPHSVCPCICMWSAHIVFMCDKVGKHFSWFLPCLTFKTLSTYHFCARKCPCRFSDAKTVKKHCIQCRRVGSFKIHVPSANLLLSKRFHLISLVDKAEVIVISIMFMPRAAQEVSIQVLPLRRLLSLFLHSSASKIRHQRFDRNPCHTRDPNDMEWGGRQNNNAREHQQTQWWAAQPALLKQSDSNVPSKQLK